MAKIPVPGDPSSNLISRIFSTTLSTTNSIPNTLINEFDPRQPRATLAQGKALIKDQFKLLENSAKTDLVNKAIGNGKKALKDILTGNPGAAMSDLFDMGSSSANSTAKDNQNSLYQKMLARKDPLLAIDWDVQLPPIPGVTALPSIFAEDISVNLPNLTVEAVPRNGTYIYFAKQSDVGELNITFYENIGLDSTTYLTAWQNLVQDPVTGLYNYPVNYKKIITLNMLIPGGQGKPFLTAGTYYISGCFPSTRGGLALQSSSAERQKITCTFSVDGVSFVRNPAVNLSDLTKAPASTSQPGTFLGALERYGLSALHSLSNLVDEAKFGKPTFVSGGASLGQNSFTA